MSAAGLLYLGLFALSAGMPRHAPALLGPWHRPSRIARLPLVGWLLLALSLLAALLTPEWPRSLVTWFGLAPLAAGIVLLSLAFKPLVARIAAIGAILLAAIGAVAALAGTTAPV